MGTGADNTQIYMRCATLELLIAESMCIETQINEKMQALVRMVQFSECCPGGPVSLSSNDERVPSRLNFMP